MGKKDRKPSIVNPRHKVVADAIMEGASPSDAVRAAGYHPGNASNVMRSEDIQQMLDESRAEIVDATSLKRLDVLELFLEAIQMARIQADPCQMINGADKIAKMMGFYAPEVKRLEISGDNANLHNKLRGLTDAELVELAAGRAKVIEGETLN